MAKQLMSFKFDDSIVSYLQCVVKNSDFSMTDYIEGLIEQERDFTLLTSWDRGCVITSGGMFIVVRNPYYMTQISLMEQGIGIIAAIPDELIPIDKCIEIAVAQVRKKEDILYQDEDEIYSIDIQDPKDFSNYLASRFDVDVKARILE